MLNIAERKETLERKVLHRTKGHQHGPVTRLVSPGDLGELIKPFVFLDMFNMDASRENLFGYHPHSGIVTVTVIIEGNVKYEDSTGKAGLLTAGTVEWMQAGGGVWHTADPVPQVGTRLRGFQLWLALPAAIENAEPESLYIEPHEIPKTGPARVIIGEYQGVSSPLPKIASITYLHVSLADGEQWTFDPPANHDVLWIALNEGSVRVSGEQLSNEIAIFDSKSTSLTIEAQGSVSFVLGSAERHPHPLITGSYSVHTTEDALRIGEEGIKKVGKRLKAEGRI
ncbi:pirin family protein [Methylotenera sp.]|uniref:pirin family protein n=1 Tax=Methylotenera sp. TaxID=2051956 RepID=UPI002489214A|nr:pirin family protein [Methylotenera sp.]MDI1299580.1 pirin family protein [Methylotenera sp.]